MLAQLAAAAAHAADLPSDGMTFDDAPATDSTMASLVKRAKKKRCGECVGCTREEDCNECKYCLDKPKLGGNNTLRRQCIRRVCLNKNFGFGCDDTEVSAFTQECLEAAIAHGEATTSRDAALAKRSQGTRETPSISGLPPPPAGKRAYTKSTPGRPTHTPYQKAVMARYYEFNKMPDTQEREALGRALGLTPRAVQVWFQNRRQRLKEAKEARDLPSQPSPAAALSSAPALTASAPAPAPVAAPAAVPHAGMPAATLVAIAAGGGTAQPAAPSPTPADKALAAALAAAPMRVAPEPCAPRADIVNGAAPALHQLPAEPSAALATTLPPAALPPAMPTPARATRRGARRPPPSQSSSFQVVSWT